MNVESPGATSALVGSPIERLEDERLLTGRGRYTDDIEHDAAQAAFVRSQHAHARITGIDVSGALDIDGVLAIYTHEDLPGNLAENPPVLVPNEALVDPRTQLPLAKDEVHFAGATIAMVVASDRYVAEDAAARIRIDYEPLDPIVDLAEAAEPGARVAHSDMADNLSAILGEEAGDVGLAFESVPHTLDIHVDLERSAGMPMEPRAIVARFDPDDRILHIHDTTQSSTLIRAGVANALEIEPERVHVVAPDVGGGFGCKIMFYPEEALIPFAAMQLQMPVKWTEDRRENFIGTNHERRQIHDVKVGFDDDGRILALETKYLHDTGAYCPYGVIVPVNTASHLVGPYKIPNYRYEFRSLYTNTVPTSPYRGAGRVHATFTMERVIEHVAAELGVDSAEVRRRNLIRPEEFPYSVGVTAQDGGQTIYDSGNYEQALDITLEKIGWAGFAEQRAAAENEGRRLGIGIGMYLEGTGLGPYEGAAVSVLDDGRVTVATGLCTQGQGHHTVFAQIVADELGVSVGDVEVTTGDTDKMPYATGTFASRAAVVSGNAVKKACVEIRRQAAELAANALGVDATDLVFVDGQVRVANSDADGIPLGRLSLIANPLRYAFSDEATRAAELARSAYKEGGLPLPEGKKPGLNASEFFSPRGSVWGYGVHAAIVEIDLETCNIKIHKYVVMHDCGNVLNPRIVQGQVIGGFAQGIGGAFYERIAYDETGQIANASFMDFMIPYATEVPTPELYDTVTPSPWNDLGLKGVGEGGLIPVPVTIVNAIGDALGTSIDIAPLSPQHIFDILHR